MIKTMLNDEVKTFNENNHLHSASFQDKYKIIAPNKWLTFGEFLNNFKNSTEKQERLILTSDGTLTRLISALFLAKTSFEVCCQNDIPPNNEMVHFLNRTINDKMITRDVWLGCKEQKKLVFAHSVILVAKENKQLYKDVINKHKPLGLLIKKYNLGAIRDYLLLGVIKSEIIANKLGLKEDTPLWARTYRLTAKNNIGAFIFEVFSPELVKK